MRSAPDSRTALLLEIIDQAWSGRSWNGVTLRGSLRGVSAKDAAWRPAPGRNCIWDLVLHCAYWKHTVRRRITFEKGGGFARSPANFPALPDAPGETAWRADIALLEAEHRALRAAVAALSPALLQRPSAKKRWRRIEEIHGIAAHDQYHTGQIQLLKRLMP